MNDRELAVKLISEFADDLQSGGAANFAKVVRSYLSSVEQEVLPAWPVQTCLDAIDNEINRQKQAGGGETYTLLADVVTNHLKQLVAKKDA